MTEPTTPEAGMRLGPCPFCGGAGRLTFGTYELDAGYHAVCEGRKDCPMFCSTPYRVHDTRDEAIAAWNARAAAPVPPAGGEGEAQLRFMSANLRDIEGTEDFLIHYHERVLVADNIDAALAARAQPPVGEVVNSAHAAYGALWCMVTDNPVIHAARKELLGAIGGKGSQGQRDAIAWAVRHVQPPSDAEIMAIDAHPTEPAAWDGGGAITEDMVYRGADVLNASKLTECFGDAGPWMGLSRAVLDAALAAGGEK